MSADRRLTLRLVAAIVAVVEPLCAAANPTYLCVALTVALGMLVASFLP